MLPYEEPLSNIKNSLSTIMDTEMVNPIGTLIVSAEIVDNNHFYFEKEDQTPSLKEWLKDDQSKNKKQSLYSGNEDDRQEDEEEKPDFDYFWPDSCIDEKLDFYFPSDENTTIENLFEKISLDNSENSDDNEEKDISKHSSSSASRADWTKLQNDNNSSSSSSSSSSSKLSSSPSLYLRSQENNDCCNNIANNSNQHYVLNELQWYLFCQIGCITDQPHARYVWKVIDESPTPNLINSLLNTQSCRKAFQILLEKCGWVEDKLFDGEKSLLLYSVVVNGSLPPSKRKDASKKIDHTLRLRKSLEECSQIKPIGSTSEVADIIVRVFGDYCPVLLTENCGIFLMEYLFQLCSVDKKIYIANYVLGSNFLHLAFDALANYMVTLVIDWLSPQHSDAQTMSAKDRSRKNYLWQRLSEFIISKECTQYLHQLCLSKHGSFVMKKFGAKCGFETKVAILQNLGDYGVLENIAQDRYGKYVYKSVVGSLKKCRQMMSRNKLLK